MWSISSSVRVQIGQDSGVGAIENPDRFEQAFVQYYIPEDPEKIFTHAISMVRRQKMSIFWHFKEFYKQNYLL